MTCLPGRLSVKAVLREFMPVRRENIKQRGGLAAKLADSAVEVIMLPMFGGG